MPSFHICLRDKCTLLRWSALSCMQESPKRNCLHSPRHWEVSVIPPLGHPPTPTALFHPSALFQPNPHSPGPAVRTPRAGQRKCLEHSARTGASHCVSGAVKEGVANNEQARSLQVRQHQKLEQANLVLPRQSCSSTLGHT